MSRKHKKDNQKVFQSYTMILQFGISMIVPIGICVGLGIFISDKLHASWIVIPFFFIGAEDEKDQDGMVSRRFRLYRRFVL